MGNSGKVLMIFKGDYNASTTYQKLNVVYYNNRSYVCKQTSTGNAPTNTTYWQALTGDASAEIQALTNYVADTGVKNLLDNSVKDIGTFSGVTVSQDSKGRFILNGTATANDSIRCGTVTLPAGKYSFNGMTQSGSSSTFFLNITPRWDGTTNYNLETTGDYSGTTAGELTFIVRIYFRSGVTFNNTVFEPMIRDATITDASYQPYAKTNVELTDVAQQLDGNYVLKSFSKVTAAKDNVKTRGTLLVEALTALQTVISNLGNNEVIQITTVYAHGANMVVNYPDYLVQKTDTVDRIMASNVINSLGDGLEITSVRVASGNGYFSFVDITSDGTTFYNRSSNVEDYSNTEIKYMLYEKIS